MRPPPAQLSGVRRRPAQAMATPRPASSACSGTAADGVSVSRLPTNTTTRHHAVQRWFNFIAGFSPEFVASCCEESRVRSARLLDPFAGCGTALVEGIQRGYSAVGYEPHPVFARAARAKLPNSSWRAVDRIEAAILAGLSRPVRVAELPEAPRAFLAKLFDQAVLASLLGARAMLEAEGLVEDDLAFLILSRVLDRCSHSQTDGIYKAPTSEKTTLPPRDACREIVRLVRDDILAWPPRVGQAHIYERSSESMGELPDETVDLIVTSPPYLNNFDFAEMTRMQLYFWGLANSWSEITKRVRARLVVNTTTALGGHKDKQTAYRDQIPSSLHARLGTVVSTLRQLRNERAGKKEYDFLVYPYFAQMTRILRECRRVLRERADVHLVVADAALYGVHISTPQFLAEIMGALGFKNTRCSQMRRRGHRWVLSKRDGSPIGLGEYHISAQK